jgi:quinone-modifying oxidoreductase subunit QmoB
VSDEKKFIGYICTGCGIGDRLDPSQLEMIMTREGKIPECKHHEMLCNAEGVQMINDDIAAGANHIVIAACSRRAKVEAFNFPTVAMTRANLREGVIWSRPEGDEHQESTQEMADDYIRMACAEIKAMNPPKPSGEQGLTRKLLVVGGGVTGMTAAIEAAAAGYQVDIVEKTGALGGHAADLYKRVPFKAAPVGTSNARDAQLPQPEEPGVAELIAKVEGSDKITVYLNSTIT